MKKILLFLGFLLGNLSGPLHAREAEPNKAIAEMEKRLIGEWKLVDGLPDEDDKKDRIWNFAKDHTVTDSQEDRKMHYHLVQNAGGGIWMLMLYSLGNSGPMVVKIQMTGETLKLQQVGRTPEGSYGAVPDGTLTFKRQKEEG